MKNFLFQKPMQLFIHGQWWSIFNTHLLQAEQWWHLSGLNTLHMRQYLLRLFSGSPKWNPQNTGTYPGSVVIAWKNDHTSITNSTWKIVNKIPAYIFAIKYIVLNIKNSIFVKIWYSKLYDNNMKIILISENVRKKYKEMILYLYKMKNLKKINEYINAIFK